MKLVKIAITASLFLGLAACGSSSNTGSGSSSASATKGSGSGTSTATLRVAANSNGAVLPLIIAQDQGYFKDQGLNVKFTKVASIANLPQTVGTSYDIVLTVPTVVINANAHGIDLAPVSGASFQDQSNKQSFLIASKKSGVKNLADLDGKTIGTPTVNGTLNLATKVLLKHAGVDLHSVKFLQVTSTTLGTQLKQGRVDAVEATAPFSAALLADKSNVDLGSCYRALGNSVAAIGWVAKKDWTNTHRNEITRFKAALNQGIKYIKTNRSEAYSTLQKFSGIPASVLSSSPLPTFTTEVQESDWKTWLSAMQQIDNFKGNVNIDSIVNQ